MNQWGDQVVPARRGLGRAADAFPPAEESAAPVGPSTQGQPPDAHAAVATVHLHIAPPAAVAASAVAQWLASNAPVVHPAPNAFDIAGFIAPPVPDFLRPELFANPSSDPRRARSRVLVREQPQPSATRARHRSRLPKRRSHGAASTAVAAAMAATFAFWQLGFPSTLDFGSKGPSATTVAAGLIAQSGKTADVTPAGFDGGAWLTSLLASADALVGSTSSATVPGPSVSDAAAADAAIAPTDGAAAASRVASRPISNDLKTEAARVIASAEARPGPSSQKSTSSTARSVAQTAAAVVSTPDMPSTTSASTVQATVAQAVPAPVTTLIDVISGGTAAALTQAAPQVSAPALTALPAAPAPTQVLGASAPTASAIELSASIQNARQQIAAARALVAPGSPEAATLDAAEARLDQLVATYASMPDTTN